MFYARVCSCSRDRDGRVQRFDKSFSSPEEYRAFLTDNPGFRADRLLPRFGSFGWDDPTEYETVADTPRLPEGVDLDRYERASREMELEERRKSQRKADLEAGKERLAKYLERFRAAGRQDLSASVEQDLRKIDEELASIN